MSIIPFMSLMLSGLLDGGSDGRSVSSSLLDEDCDGVVRCRGKKKNRRKSHGG